MKLITIFLIIFIHTFLFAEWTIIETFSIPEGAAGLAYDGQYLYCGIYGANGDEVFQIDPATGAYSLLFYGPQEDAFGMTYDGEYLWITDHQGPSSDPAVAMQLDMSGNLISQFNLPDHYMSGIAYDNGDFWVSTYYDPDGHIYKLDSTGTILQDFPAPDNQPWDLCLENSNLWMADYWGDTLYKIDPSDGTLLESFSSEGVDPAGIVFDGEYLWYCDNGTGGSDCLYKVDLGGTGTPAIQIGLSEYDFGNVVIGDIGVLELEVTNIGTANLEILSMDFTTPQYTSIFEPPHVILPGDTDYFTIHFTPDDWGEFPATLYIGSNDPIYPEVEVTLNGYGIYAQQEIEIEPAALYYDATRVGATTGLFLEISNQGALDLIINDLLINDENFYIDNNIEFPITLETCENYSFRVWFNPGSASTFNAILEIYSNDEDENPLEIDLQGSGFDQEYPMGNLLWQYEIDTSWDNSPKAISPISDISGDGFDDVIICSEDNYIRCFNGNSFGIADILWEYEIEAGDVYSQKGLDIGEDIDEDGYQDLVIGTTGGDRAIRVLSGATGEQIWIHDTHEYGDGGWVYQVSWQYDYNDDEVPDVLAATGDDAADNGPKRVYCLNGLTGETLWDYYAGGPVFSVIGIEDVTGDDKPDVLAGASNEWETEGIVHCLNGENGNMIWNYTTAGSSVWGLSQIDDINTDGINDIIAGDFAGNYYGLNAINGSPCWSNNIGTYILITRFEKLDDINGDDHPDILVEHTGNNAVVIDGFTGEHVWDHLIGDNSLSVDRIPDITGDEINDVLIGSLNNSCYFLDGATGAELESIYLGTAVDAISAIPDIVGDNSWEMVAGGRDGTVLCLSGGEAAALGYVEGFVSLVGGNGNVQNVIINIGDVIISPDSTGYFHLAIPPGIYDITFTIEGYQIDIIEAIEVLESQTTIVDITLIYLFPPQNLAYTIDENDVILTWDEPDTTREVTSYKVYRDETEITEVTILTYTDENLTPAIYEYYVTAIYEEVQESEPSNLVTVEITNAGNNLLPLVTQLNGNYPNPFNPSGAGRSSSTAISFQLAEKNLVELVIYNMKGQKVKELMNSNLDAGYYKAVWNGKDENRHSVASGLYFIKLKVGRYTSTRKCLLLK